MNLNAILRMWKQENDAQDIASQFAIVLDFEDLVK